MDVQNEQKIVALLEQIVSNQEIQLEKQAQLIALQTTVFESHQATVARTAQLHDHVMGLQHKAGKALIFVLSLIFVLVLYLVILTF